LDDLGHAVDHRGGYPGRGGRVRRRPFRRPAAGLTAAASLLLVAGLLSAGCGEGDAAEGPARIAEVRPVPQTIALEGGVASLDELLRTVERALADSDTARLFDLMVSEREYREVLYPALPASQPPINAPFETIWVTHFPEAYRGLLRTVGLYGGRDLHILELRFDRPDQDFGRFILHETSRVDIQVDGRREDNRRLFGSVIHAGGRWKVLSYPDTD
jgi:hypothetical protein